MDETPTNEPQSADSTAISKPRRKRTGRKRTSFRTTPRPAWPVRGLWDAAPQEEKTRAHETCMAILEYWLGKKSKSQVAQELSVTPLRVWQMSQMALSGMMAGLLPQPRRRVTAEVFETGPGGMASEPRELLMRRVARLEKELARTEDLVRVLRMAPWANPASESTPKEGSTRVRKSSKKARTSHPKKDAARDARAHRTNPAREAPSPPGSGGAG